MLLDEMAARLVALGLTTGYAVSKGSLPATPDAAISLHETGGTATEIAFGGHAVEGATLQVVVRGQARDYATPRLVIERIYQSALSWGGFVAGGVRYMAVTPLQPPFPRHRDANERVEFACNFLVQKEPSPTA